MGSHRHEEGNRRRSIMPPWWIMALILVFLIGVLILLEVLYMAAVIYWLPSGLAGTDFDSDAIAHLGSFGSAFGGVSAFFTGVGFAGVATTIFIQYKDSQFQSEELKDQLSLLKESNQEQTNLAKSQIYQNSWMGLQDLTKYFIDHPEDRQYFHSAKPFPEQEPDFSRLYTLAELFVDGMDTLLTNMEFEPKAVNWAAWQRYFWDIYHNSPIVQKYLEDHPDWYDDYMFELLKGERPKVV
jgi:hypothetical protein